MVQCQRTRQIAEALCDKLRDDSDRYSGVEVFYDHGDSSKTEVCQPTSYMGRRYGADATLSVIDIVLVKNGKVFLLVEVEESVVRPKTVLGDVFGAILANRVRIHGKSYPIDNAVLIVALTFSKHGKRCKKYARLERHLKKYLAALQETTPGTSIT